jgi:pyruvate carboxylase
MSNQVVSFDKFSSLIAAFFDGHTVQANYFEMDFEYINNDGYYLAKSVTTEGLRISYIPSTGLYKLYETGHPGLFGESATLQGAWKGYGIAWEKYYDAMRDKVKYLS